MIRKTMPTFGEIAIAVYVIAFALRSAATVGFMSTILFDSYVGMVAALAGGVLGYFVALWEAFYPTELGRFGHVV